jgi:hypothetical protein
MYTEKGIDGNSELYWGKQNIEVVRESANNFRWGDQQMEFCCKG